MNRAEAIKELMPFTLCDVYSDNLREACQMAIAALREQEHSKWISVKERLPERKDANPYESVLAIHKDDGFARSWIFDVVAEYSQEFTHWMPLPEPPKEGAEG